MKRLVLAALFLWTGFLLVVIPWSAFWDRNYFAQALPVVRDFIGNDYVRGAVSGLGVIDVYLGLTELVKAIVARPSPPSSLGTSPFSPRE